jgi:hypothetical protein
MPIRLLLLMSLLPFLAGCAGMAAPPPRDEAPLPPTVTTDADSCGAGRVQDRVGRRFADSLGDSMLAESGAAAMRVMHPGQAYTLEYRADRLSIRLDEDGVITTIGCG